MFCIGFDIGGTKSAVSVGETGETISLLDRAEVPTGTPEQTLSALAPHAKKFSKQYGAQAIGVSCGGPLNTKQGVILDPPNLPSWHNFPLVRSLEQNYGLPCTLQNDANACAVAEWKYGAGRGASNLIFFTFGTGLGAGLILDGKLYEGANGNAGEAGHVRLSARGPVGFGKSGSFEGFCSGGGIARLALRMAKKKSDAPAYMIAETVTTKQLSEYARAGDAFARDVFSYSGKMLGKGLSMMIDILNPEVIVLGGVYMRAHDLMEESMYREIRKEALSVSRAACRILPAMLSENIGDYAALSIAGGEF